MWYSTCYPANNGDTSQSLHHRFFSHKITNTIISVSWRTPCSYFSWRDSTIITAEHGDIHWRLILSMLGRYVSTVYIHPVKTLWVIDLPVVQLKSHTQLIGFNAVWLPRFNSDRVLFHNKCFCSCANITMMAALRKGFLLILADLSLYMYAKFYSHHTVQAFEHLDRSNQTQNPRKSQCSDWRWYHIIAPYAVYW